MKELRAVGLPPDLIFCRAEDPLDPSVKKKISLFCMVPPTNVISVHDVSNIMHVPLLLLEQKVPDMILLKLRRNIIAVDEIPAVRSLIISLLYTTSSVSLVFYTT